MKTWRIKKFGAVVAVLAVALTSLAVAAPTAQAQSDQYETCALYGRVVGTGGQVAADAATALQALGAPNPAGINDALETIINLEADVPPAGSRPSSETVNNASTALDGYYGDLCADLDICPLIRQAIATNDGSSAEAARLARSITAPAPPGIDAALALIAGEIDESPFHASVAEAQAQIESYFPCVLLPVPNPAPVGGIPADVAATCGDLNVLSIPEGPFAIAAAESLRARGAPNPSGIEAALDVIVAAADFANESPPLAEIDAALATLQAYFGGACANLDRCVFVTQIGGTDAAAAVEAARLLRRIETPSPPGIDAALALIAGDIDDSPFHDNVAQAVAQIVSYYSCGDGAGADDGGSTTDDGLAFTGSTTVPVALLGVALMTSGAGVLSARRRLVHAAT